MLDLAVFALIGLFVGAGARLWYPRREPKQIMGTMLIGIIGAVLGGLLSWAIWPDEKQFHSGSLLVALIGSIVAIIGYASWAYARSTSVPPARLK